MTYREASNYRNRPSAGACAGIRCRAALADRDAVHTMTPCAARTCRSAGNGRPPPALLLKRDPVDVRAV